MIDRLKILGERFKYFYNGCVLGVEHKKEILKQEEQLKRRIINEQTNKTKRINRQRKTIISNK